MSSPMEVSNEVPNTSQNNLSEENTVENEAIMNEAENEEVSQMTLEALDQIPDIIEKVQKMTSSSRMALANT